MKPVAPRSVDGVIQPLGVPGNWRLAEDFSFSGRSLNQSIWHVGWFGGRVTAPLSRFENDCYAAGNVTLPGDGTINLAVTATRSRCDGVTHPYTGALVTTDPADRSSRGGFEYRYGVLQARVYVPGDGHVLANWPGVWTDGAHWPQDGEDDILEGLFGQACFHFHSPHYARHGPGGCVSLAPGWHTFASDWQPGSVSYYYDGVHVGTVTIGVTSAPMFIIIDNTVWRNTPTTTAPGTMRIAYVKIWHRATAPAAGS
ncbi:MAG: glycoside hydrolase family 16 protein [Solirubrobacteraceae bacterium]